VAGGRGLGWIWIISPYTARCAVRVVENHWSRCDSVRIPFNGLQRRRKCQNLSERSSHTKIVGAKTERTRKRRAAKDLATHLSNRSDLTVGETEWTTSSHGSCWLSPGSVVLDPPPFPFVASISCFHHEEARSSEGGSRSVLVLPQQPSGRRRSHCGTFVRSGAHGSIRTHHYSSSDLLGALFPMRRPRAVCRSDSRDRVSRSTIFLRRGGRDCPIGASVAGGMRASDSRCGRGMQLHDQQPASNGDGASHDRIVVPPTHQQPFPHLQ